MHSESVYLNRAINAGALGYLPKNTAAEKLVHAVERVLGGLMFLSDEALLCAVQKASDEGSTDKLMNPVQKLTDRERAVFEAIGRGMSVKQLAASMQLSAKTVETYRARAMKKLKMRTSNEFFQFAVRWIIEHEEQ